MGFEPKRLSLAKCMLELEDLQNALGSKQKAIITSRDEVVLIAFDSLSTAPFNMKTRRSRPETGCF